MASGDTLEISIRHSVVGNRNFSVKSDEDINFDIGGYSSERQINGNGTGHKKMNAKPWMLEGVSLYVDKENGDQEFLQDISDSPIDAGIEWEHKDGTIYSMTGSIEGDLKFNSNSGYIPISFSGNGKPKKIA